MDLQKYKLPKEARQKIETASNLQSRADELLLEAIEILHRRIQQLEDRAGGRINKKQAIKLIDGITSYTSLDRYVEKFGPAGYLQFGADNMIETSEVLRFNKDKKSGLAYRKARKAK